MSFGEQRKKAFDFCADATKQLMTISTAVVTLTITFAKDFVINVRPSAKIWAYLAWVALFLSILSGIFVLLALTAELEPKDPMHRPASIRAGATGWSFLQQVMFLVAIILTVIFGITATGSPGNANGKPGGKAGDTVVHRVDSVYIVVCDTCCQPAKKARRCVPIRAHVLAK